MSESTGQKTTWRNSAWTVVIGFPLVCIILLALLAPWAVSRSYRQAARRACLANLKQIDSATASLFLERHGPASKVPEIPTDEDLFGVGKLIPNKLICPAGGIYTYGWHSTNQLEKPRCSIPGHTI